MLNVYNSNMTKADGNYDTSYERQLNRLDCFFYVKDKTDQPCVYYHKAEVNDLDQATIPFFVNDLVLKEIFPKGALCDVFVIANLPGDHTFEANTPETTVQALGELTLDMTKGEYDVYGKSFVMTGAGIVQKGKNSNATATIALARVASKVTMTVKIPMSIEVQNRSSMDKMVPVFVDNEGNSTLKTSFRYGTSKSYLSSAFPEDSKNFIWTNKFPYTESASSLGSYYVYTCDVPFYTYARSWDKGSESAAYVTFEMPWGVDEDNDGKADDDYKTYYYQLLVNGGGRNFVPNAWYDMIVTVGVLGSTVEAQPKELEELSYYVLDWTAETSNGEHGSGDRHENVEIEKFNYLEVPQTYIEMDNVNEVSIRYNASHKIGVKFNKSAGKTVPGLPATTDLHAFSISNLTTTGTGSNQTQDGTPRAVALTDIILKDPEEFDADETNVVSQFTDNNKGLLTFKYNLSDDVYSPAYVFLTIWLDVNGDGVHDSDEILTQDVTIVMYPAIYIIGEESLLYSVFVNGNYNKDRKNSSSDLNNMGYLTINNQRVGKATGYDASRYMHVITVSAFNTDNYKFAYNNNNVLDTEYIIGDPRSRVSNTYGVSWASDGQRTLTNYYPTSTEANNYQVIAPKFRISSKLAGYSHSSPQGAAYRCASYQEAGYPAGRWRLPTTAEVLFVINLQKLGKIQNLFHGSSTYASATDNIKNSDNNFTLKTGHDGFDNNTNLSVRCVYDEWYWGSEPEARKNNSYNNYGGYEFTWGDEKVY